MPSKRPAHPNDILRSARIERGWSQEDLAERLGTNAFTVSRWELGQAFPSPHYRQKLAELFAQSLPALGIYPQAPPGNVVGERTQGTRPSYEKLSSITTLARESGSTDPVSASATCLLPPRPRHFLGRKVALQTMLSTLETCLPGHMYAISGMPGIGKSALAAEVVHQLSGNPKMAAWFPDGILTISGQGHQGETGLMAVLEEILANFDATRFTQAHPTLESLGRQVCSRLSARRSLILLDDLAPTFPFAQARRLLLTSRLHRSRALEGCTLLFTSRLVPAPGLAEWHLALGPLDPESARELLMLWVEHPFPAEEQTPIQQLCELVGYVPGAIKWIARTLSLGLSASWLITHFNQFTQARKDEDGLYAGVLQAMTMLPADLQARLARLAPLGTRSFGIEDAILLHLPEAVWSGAPEGGPEPGLFPATALQRQEGSEPQTSPDPITAPILAATAADLLHLTAHSLLLPERPASNRFRMPPLFQAVAADLERQQHAEALALAQAHTRNLPEARWQQVFSALVHAWYSRNAIHVVEIAYSLHRMSVRLPARLGEQVLQWGIAASQALHDHYYLVRFLTRLGKLLMYRGDFATAETYLKEAITFAQPLFRHATSDRVLQLLIPWSNLTLIPGLQDVPEEAERRVRRLLRQSEVVGAGEEVAAAYNKLAFYGRLKGMIDHATRANETAQTLARGQDWSSGMLAEIALEQARLAGAYERTTQILKRLLATPLDPQAEADHVYDQALYALKEGRKDEAHAHAQQSLKLAQQARTSVIVRRSQELLGQLSMGKHL